MLYSSSNFTAAKGLMNPHLQTLLPRVIRKKPLFTPIRQTINTPDGDFLDLAWSEDWLSDSAQQKPIYILFHGLEGSFESPYANGLMHAFAKQGYLAVMMHFRGCSGKPNKLARAYHSGETEDARLVLELITSLFPAQKKIATGISLGGNMLVNYLAKYRDDPLVDAANVVSAPLDLTACSTRIDQGFSKVYRQYLLGSLKRNSIKKWPLLNEALGVSQQTIKSFHRLYEFDDVITAPLHGFNGAEHYYKACSGLPKLNDISIPLKVIHAKDDPFMTSEVIPTFRLNRNIDYHLFENGGHVGFISGSLRKPSFWLEDYLPRYYAQLIDD